MDLDALAADLDERLADADAALTRDYPGERAGRQPVHTVYVPADAYDDSTVHTLGRAAEKLVLEHVDAFLGVIDGDEDLLARVLAKLATEAVEDLRIDFEDGYGRRTDKVEDAAAEAAAEALAASRKAGSASPFSGIRIKSFDPATRKRGVRTLGTFLGALGEIPEGFVVTLPKVTSVDQVEAMVMAAERIEKEVDGRLLFELQIETPQSILGPDGTALVARMIHASDGRCTGLHYGTYDYSAACGIAAGEQSLEHPVADHAKAVMQAAAAGTGVRLSDGSTNRLPVGDVDEITAAWSEHLRLVRRSLERGFYQGWDLHPGQLPTRYAATYSFFRDGFPDAAGRLAAYVGESGGSIRDEPATARALADFLLRGVDCGALEEGDVTKATGVRRGRLLKLAGRTS